MLSVSASRPWWRTWRVLAGLALLAAQLGVVVISHSGSSCCVSKYFAWAPNDYSIDYSITSVVNGHRLSAQAIAQRYDFNAAGFFEDPPEKLEHELRRVDQLYGKGQRVQGTLRYRLDGHRPVTWSWTVG
jgi:hypothetical protein